MNSRLFALRTPAIFCSLTLIAALASSCRKPDGSQVTLETNTPFTVAEAPPPLHQFEPLPCEAVGVAYPSGRFEPIMFLTGPHQHGGGETVPLLQTNLLKIYRGTNLVAESNHFLGEFRVTDFGNEHFKDFIDVDFEFTENHDLLMYARVDAQTGRLLTLQRVDVPAN
jgi:hypothetical protein